MPDFAATPDGRYVVFTGFHLTGVNPTFKNDCFVRDTVTGTTRSVSGAMPRATALSMVQWVDISPDGRHVFFNLLERPDGSSAILQRGFLGDLANGQLWELSAPQGTYLGDITGVGFSPESDLFVFKSEGRILPIDKNNFGDIYVARLSSATKPRVPVALIAPLGQ